jgi:hypothetical protein
MEPRGLIIVGCGKRVRETALPALHRLGGRIQVRRILARTAKLLSIENRSYRVEPFERTARGDLDGADLVYVAVAKDAVPGVLARLLTLEPSSFDLLIDTPVVRFRHLAHARHLDRFRRAWVAEDCIELPWIAALHALERSGEIGRCLSIEFARSAYAYHAFATAKAVLGARRVVRGRRGKLPGGGARRDVELDGGRTMISIEPRDYATGHVVVRGESGSVSDSPDAGASHVLTPIATGTRCTGFRAGSVRIQLAEDEIDLARGDAEAASVTARQEALKRVGFLRLWKRILDGRGAYPVEDALEDMVADYHLERFGRWRSTPLTSPRSPLARAWMRLVLR